MTVLEATGGTALLGLRALRAMHRRGVAFRETLVQLHEHGVRTVWLVVPGMAFFGAVMVTIADDQARRLTGNLTLIGPAYFELIVREFGPLVTALLVAARTGAMASAELSTMKVNEQVEALRLSAGDPLAELVAPRVLAGTIGMPALAVLGTAAAALSAAFTATSVIGVDGAAFLDARYVDAGDVACAALKTVLCGAFIPLAASWHALRSVGGAEAVGEATTSGVVTASLGCLVIDFVVALAFYLVGA